MLSFVLNGYLFRKLGRGGIYAPPSGRISSLERSGRIGLRRQLLQTYALNEKLKTNL